MKFDRVLIADELALTNERAARYESVFRFGPGSRAFESPSSEETIWFLRGRVRFFDSLSHFWVQSLSLVHEAEWRQIEQLAVATKPLPIAAEQAMMRIEAQSQTVFESFKLSTEDDLRRAYVMRDEWSDFLVVAEGEVNIVYFEWSTTA